MNTRTILRPALLAAAALGVWETVFLAALSDLPWALAPLTVGWLAGLILAPAVLIASAAWGGGAIARRRGAGDLPSLLFGADPDGVAHMMMRVVALAAGAAGAGAAAWFAVDRVNRPVFVAGAAALGATGGLVFAALVALGLARPMAAVVRRLGVAGWAAGAALTIAAVIGLLVTMIATDLARAWITLPSMGGALVVGLTLAWWCGGGVVPRRLEPATAPRPGWRRWWPRAAVPAMALAALGAPVDHRSLGALTRGKSVSGHLAALLRRATDVDRDGHGAILGGYDCRLFDPAVHPGQPDPLGDGLDADCSGADGPPGGAAVLELKPKFVSLRTAARPRANFLLVTLDTIRTDHVGAYGYSRDTTPAFDALAKESVRFERAYSCGTRTFQSVPCVLFGRHASSLGWIKSSLHKYIASPEPSMASALRASGWQTMAVLLDWHWVKKRHAIRGGFDVWDATIRRRSKLDPIADKTSAKALALLDARDTKRPFFLWAHYIDAHSPWPSNAKTKRYGTAKADLYDGVVRTVDDAVGALLDGVRARGLWDNTVIVVTSDHGEALGEHGRIYHGWDVFEVTTRVPLLVRVPGLPPRLVPGPVSGLDLAPSLLSVLGVSRGWEKFEGWNFAPLLEGDVLPPRPPIVTERWNSGDEMDGRLVGLVDWPRKVIVEIDTGNVQLYDLSKDPEEIVDLSGGRGALELAETDPAVAMVLGWIGQHPLRSVLAGKGDAER